jgi:hypothetical protein
MAKLVNMKTTPGGCEHKVIGDEGKYSIAPLRAFLLMLGYHNFHYILGGISTMISVRK